MSQPAPQSTQEQKPVPLPAIPALWAGTEETVLLTADGELETLPHAQAQIAIKDSPVLVCHAPYTKHRLGTDTLQTFDLLELFAFVHPAEFCVPTPQGLAKALGLNPPMENEDIPPFLTEATEALLKNLRKDPWQKKAAPLKIAAVMGRQGQGWPWTPFIFSALGQTYDPSVPPEGRSALNVWKHLPEWAEGAPPAPPGHHPVTAEEARTKLQSILGTGAETREEQSAYAATIAQAFAPRKTESLPQTVLAEAGTGVGKTLGYLAPASVWAEKNKGPVWISTYTKNLQRQIVQELEKLYPDPAIRDSKVAVRKGRENYLCLLNLEDAAAAAPLARDPRHAIAAGIMARWAAATQDGDLSGGDFPGWLAGLLGFHGTTGLADRRGECVYSACDHYHRCFVERSVRKAKHAEIVVANHALVMIQTADAGPDTDLPRRYVFDEGHHIFDAADSAFAAHLSAREMQDMRRWLRGAENGRKTRARGLKRRAEDLAAGDAAAEKDLQDILHAATCLTGEGWTTRLKGQQPKGPGEKFIAAIYAQIAARTGNRHGAYSLETDTHPVNEEVLNTARTLKKDLEEIYKPMGALAAKFRKKLSQQSDTLDADTRRRLDALCSSLGLKSLTLAAWIAMLETLETGEIPERFVDWMEIARIDGKAYDIGLFRHFLNPMEPFSEALSPHAHGLAVTSATLRDGTGDTEEDWRIARERTGTELVGGNQTVQEKFDSPFHYAAQTRIFVVTDVNRDDPGQVAAAYRTLFEASGGGALGLFTAVSRLRAAHGRIAGPLEKQGIPVYAQHIDDMDAGTLVDIFRDDKNACLLGTDAVRDGVDVPGDSLRLIVFDRVPWPRPSILHRARREAFGKKRYDDMITRLKLKQAYGRLIRRATDRGVFVMLDSRLPSNLHGAFPETVAVHRAGLADIAAEIRKFLA